MSRDGYVYATERQFNGVLGLHATRPDDAPTTLHVAITANLVATNAPQLRLICDDAIVEGRRNITLDLQQCQYIDAKGWGQLVAIGNRAHRLAGFVVIANASADLLTLFHSHGIASLFRFAPSQEG